MLDFSAYQAASLYLAFNLILLLVLGWRTAKARQATGIGLGHGDNEDMMRAMRIHANFAEYAPLTMVGLLALAAIGAPVLLIHVLGSVFTLARIGHGFGFTAPKGKRPVGRFYGTIFTGLVLIAEAAALLYFAFVG
ncbi:MAG: hypothetical protein COA85_06405 [Robiginitomaculum sp.]|nr:MAG: hypothetical protein COA85_06405 [Robiginitomaculum sp.]